MKCSPIMLRAALVVATGLALTGCRNYRGSSTMSPPAVTVELQNLTDLERDVLVRYLEGEARRKWQVEPISSSGSRDALTYRIHLRHWDEQRELHADLVSLRAVRGGHTILQNHRATTALEYTSSAARSSSMAIVRIAVVPPNADLVFDSRIPGLDRPDVVTSEGGSYRIELPFSYIKTHDYIYFHSVYKGQRRYYRYHLQSQRQEPLAPPSKRRRRDLPRWSR